MAYYTISVSKENLIHLHQIYANHQVPTENEHLLFQAHHKGTDILAYKTGKILLRGDDVSDEIITIKNGLGLQDYEAVGSDEVGTGDVFGPIVVCSVLVKLEDINFLEKLNVRDSKNINDRQIVKIAPLLAKRLIHSLLIVNPKKYNELTKNGHNLNKIKASLHNTAIINTTTKYSKPVPVILDKFCSIDNYFNYLKNEKFVYRDINFHERAESIHLSVACASIIARYAFLVKLHEYSKHLGIQLPKGAGEKVDEIIKEILATKGLSTLESVAKMNYKNVTRLI